MALKKYKPTSPGRRFMATSGFEEITKSEPEKSLVEPLAKKAGRNNRGRITTRHQGGGHKRTYRVIDFKRRKLDVSGTVERLDAPIVPHMGWNTVEPPESSVLFRGIEQERFYFVHSFGVLKWEFEQNSEHMLPPQVTWSRHGSPFIAAVENGALSATQFHPEKSGQAGLQLLRNWLETLPSTGRLDAALAARDAQTAGQEESDA